jgi:6-phosphogluconolactonase (cycloisomerase 2 family)
MPPQSFRNQNLTWTEGAPGLRVRGRWVFAANQDSGTVVQFGLNQDRGRFTESLRALEINSPVCIVFAPRF